MYYFDECIRNLANDRNYNFSCYFFIYIFIFVFNSPSLSIEEVNVISTVYDNGRATCQFSFETTSGQADGEPAPIALGKNYYLIFATGILRTEGIFDEKMYR